jgi:cytoskeletal protein CcmA (bactofilin family)
VYLYVFIYLLKGKTLKCHDNANLKGKTLKCHDNANLKGKTLKCHDNANIKGKTLKCHDNANLKGKTLKCHDNANLKGKTNKVVKYMNTTLDSFSTDFSIDLYRTSNYRTASHLGQHKSRRYFYIVLYIESYL